LAHDPLVYCIEVLPTTTRLDDTPVHALAYADHHEPRSVQGPRAKAAKRGLTVTFLLARSPLAIQLVHGHASVINALPIFAQVFDEVTMHLL